MRPDTGECQGEDLVRGPTSPATVPLPPSLLVAAASRPLVPSLFSPTSPPAHLPTIKIRFSPSLCTPITATKTYPGAPSVPEGEQAGAKPCLVRALLRFLCFFLFFVVCVRLCRQPQIHDQECDPILVRLESCVRIPAWVPRCRCTETLRTLCSWNRRTSLVHVLFSFFLPSLSVLCWG